MTLELDIKAMVTSSDKMNPHETVSIMLKKDVTNNDVIGYQQLPPNILSQLRKYLNLNYDTLLKYWNDEISTSELISELKKL